MSAIHETSTMTSTKKAYMWSIIGIVSILGVLLFGLWMPEDWYAIDYTSRSLEPSLQHPFGTDHMGRDMLFRCIKGLSLSIIIGLGAAFVSSTLALLLGVLSATFGGKVDAFVLWLIDVCMGIPHVLLIIMISVALGGGIQGVTIGVIATHWPSLTRLLRAEVMQLRKEPYVLSARNYGKSYWDIGKRHFVPHVFPHYMVGLVLLFPHAILHEAGVTFLGYGLPLDMPGIGIILAESVKHISLGLWWLAFFPGLLLVTLVLLFNRVGEALNTLLDPMRVRG